MEYLNRTFSLVLGTAQIATQVGVRVKFEIEKEMTSQGASKSQLEIYNLSESNIRSLENNASNYTIIFSAGYSDQNKQILNGTIMYAETERKGPDLVTTLQILPGSAARTAAFVSINKAQSDYQIYQACLQALAPYGIAQGYFSPAVRSILEDAQYSSPHSDFGPVSRIMDLLARKNGLNFNTSDNQVNLFLPSETEDSSLFLLSSQTGMVGVPSKMQDGNYKVVSFLNGDIVPGKLLRVQSTDFPINGDLKVLKSTFKGDTWEGNEFYVEVEAALIGTQPGFVLEKN